MSLRIARNRMGRSKFELPCQVESGIARHCRSCPRLRAGMICICVSLCCILLKFYPVRRDSDDGAEPAFYLINQNRAGIPGKT